MKFVAILDSFTKDMLLYTLLSANFGFLRTIFDCISVDMPTGGEFVPISCQVLQSSVHNWIRCATQLPHFLHNIFLHF